MTPSAPGIVHEVDGVHVLPVLHERLECAGWAARAFAALRPDAVAVEIPSSLERLWLQAVDRLPQLSVLLYEDEGERTVYLPVQPADAIVEAARRAREAGIPICCADLDVDGYADYRDPAPDTYAALRLGSEAYYRAFRGRPRPLDPTDPAREAAMAFHARRLRSAGAERVLLLCGMHHADRVAAALSREQATPLTPPARRNARLVHLHLESIPEVLGEVPFYVAAYERARAGLPPAPAPEPEAPAEPERFHGAFRVLSGGRGAGGADAAAAVDRAVRGSLVEAGLDRLRLQWELLRAAERSLAAAAPDEDVRPWQRRNLARYTRNLALSSGRLVVDLFDLLVAARGCVSDNFAWELNTLAVAYPSQPEAVADLPTARIRADEMYDGVRRILLRRRHRRPKRPDWRRVLRARRGKERYPGEWLDGFDNLGICSYPPEDIIVEGFGDYLRKRGKSVLSEEQSRTVPFTTSILDGIDVRETIRHWSDHTLYVREMGRAPGEVGSVVVIFDDDEDRYSHCQTWLGEHHQESDMAFFCTEPTQAIVGPGICRATYGGFLLSHPPQRMADVWTDADYRMAETKAEVLILAALDYCEEKVVVHVAARPPRAVMHQLAGRLGLKILHLPIGTLSPSTVKKIRVMHILSGHDKRAVAKDYIW